MEKKLDLGAAWSDAVALITGNMQTVIVAMALFVVVPGVIIGLIVGPVPAGADMARSFGAANSFWFLLSAIIGMIGSLTILTAYLEQNKLSFGTALSAALAMIVPYILTNIIMWIGIGIGLFLLVIPGLFLLVKFTCASPIVAAEKEKNPIEALKKSWDMTSGNGWQILGFLVVIGIVIIVVSFVLNLITLPFLASGGIMGTIGNLIQTIFQGAASAVSLAAIAAIYRQLNSVADKGNLEETFS